MDTKTLTEIDFYRIRDEVAGFCLSEEGKKSLQEREPLTNLKEIEQLKNISREWNAYNAVSKASPFSGWEPIHHLFAIIKTSGAALTLEQVNCLGQFTKNVARVKEVVENHQVGLGLKLLPAECAKMPDGSETESKIYRIITLDGQMRDLPEIVAIRKQIASLNQKIKQIMQQFTSDQRLAGILETNVPVLRNGRQVLAVKASQQNRIPGIIHEVSQTAQTVYIEPDEAVCCSNELIQKEYELQQVINKILTELTAQLQPSIPFFRDCLPVMCLLDGTLAASRWGTEHNCVYADVCVDEPPFLRQARHPLLGQKAVPIDVRFMDGKRVLIITGPNTGGKTVTLKTFALFAMLNQAGLPVPAEEGTRLPVFENVFADIGDSQNMDMNLSTFSGHMKNIAAAVEGATAKTLVLLDELGSGTDPQEGTAISMSVLDRLIEKQSFVLVTTHMGILKNYGYTNPCCVNASVEFDTGTLSPSYRLLMGVPGESHALDIAAKSGLPQEIVKHAREYIATEQADVSALIRGLNRKHVELNKVQKEAEKAAAQAQEKYEKLKARELDLRRKENDLKKGKQQELNDFLIHSRRQLENLVRTLKEGEITREKTLGVKQFISELTAQTQRLENKIEAEEEKLTRDEQIFAAQQASMVGKHPASNKKTKKKLSTKEALAQATPTVGSGAGAVGGSAGVTAGNGRSEKSGGRGGSAGFENKPLTFEPGAFVVAGSNKNQGVLVAKSGKNAWQVQFGSVKMTVKEKDLKLVGAAAVGGAGFGSQSLGLQPDISYDFIADGDGSALERPVFELRLLGMRSEEAIRALEHQLDLCALNNFPHFSVIHGKGDGILQQVVWDYLSHSPVVANFEQAPAEDGGAGKTYVTLK